MTYLHPYLTFNGNCREAMTFYRDCLGGELTMQSVEESPMADRWPEDVQKHILHSALVKGKLMLLGSDMSGPGNLVSGNTISLSLSCGSLKETETFFTNLSRGGRVTHPLHSFFGGMIGTLTDRFGMHWLFHYENPRQKNNAPVTKQDHEKPNIATPL